jgi:ADP-heptose:LPS heptosyltransferase
MRILIAQMTRMGDMLQTTPLVTALKRRHPEAHIAVMVRNMGKIIAERNPDIDDIIVYEEDDMFLDLRSGDSNRLLKAYNTAVDYIDRIKHGNYDIVYNCTHSMTSTMLFKLAGVPKVVGAQMNPHNMYVIEGKGPACFLAGVLHRDLSELNLCDVFRHFMPGPEPVQNLTFELTDEDRAAAEALLNEHGVSKDDRLVCMQLGASDTHKRWPTEAFAELGAQLTTDHGFNVALVGVESEAPLGETFEKHAPGVAIQLFGKTSVPVLAAVLERASVLVTNDTGTMHIAAAVGCPVVLLSVGYVHFRETGPFAADCIALERRRDHLGESNALKDNPQSRTGIEPSHALAAVLILSEQLGPADWAAVSAPAGFEKVDAFYSQFAADGCLAWYPLERRPYRRVDLVRMIYRLTWIDYLQDTSSIDAANDYIQTMCNHYDLPRTAEIDQWIAAIQNDFENLATLADDGAQHAGDLVAALHNGVPMRTAKPMVAKLTQLDERIRVFGEVHDDCRPFVILAKFERENLQGDDPAILAEAAQAIYERLSERLRLACTNASRIQKTLHKPASDPRPLFQP